MGPADHKCSEGQYIIATQKTRDKNDLVIVQEKLDGSNVGVAKINGEILAITRAGYLAETSQFEQHHFFAKWVNASFNRKRFNEILYDGERICGEWLLQAHGTRYNLNHEPFVAFDIISNNKRLLYFDFIERVEYAFKTPETLHCGRNGFSVEAAMKMLGEEGFHGALDPVEGAVWRVERNGKVDFLAKYVRPDKVDGKYLPEISGTEPVWNCSLPV
jgi:hypothetical protein